MPNSTRIRRFAPSDTQVTAEVFNNAIHHGTGQFYDAAQRQAWAPHLPELVTWRARLTHTHTFVAENNSRVQGFMTIDPDGCIDLAYVGPAALRQGVGALLYKAVEEYAIQHDIGRLYAQASELARRFFSKVGWRVLSQQTVDRDGVQLTNYLMEKQLTLHA